MKNIELKKHEKTARILIKNNDSKFSSLFSLTSLQTKIRRE